VGGLSARSFAKDTGDVVIRCHRKTNTHGNVRREAVAVGDVRALGCQHEVHPERSSAPRNVGENIERVGELSNEFGEFVDDDGESTEGARVFHPLDTLETQLSFAVEKFGGETRQDPSNAVTVEVSHDAAAVRQIGQWCQCCSTLEVNADPRQSGGVKPFRPVAQQRREELRLSGSRTTTDQNMGSFRGQV
jgi:hypothetical protein